MAFKGLRVVRGPNWSWGDQDGGEGHVGTVVEVGQGGGSVVVQWDCGNRNRYCCGEEGKYDLRVFDSAPIGMVWIHTKCSSCRVQQTTGILWRCVNCLHYYLCTLCYMADKHSPEHEFLRIDTRDMTNKPLPYFVSQLWRKIGRTGSISISWSGNGELGFVFCQQLQTLTRVPPRAFSKRVEARGIFPGADVVRGHDWRWGNQDGGLGMIGKVISVQGWQSITARSVVEVEWTAIHKRNIYRRGHGGKVDLKCTVSGSSCGGYYYPDHLLVLGRSCEPLREDELAAGDNVKIELEWEVLKMMQEKHGGWNDVMIKFIGCIGVVNTVVCKESRDAVVWYRSDVIFNFNLDVLTKVDLPHFDIGDTVRVLDDLAELHRLQSNIGDWNDDMALSVGQFGRVTHLLDDGRIAVVVNGKRWIYCPDCLLPVAEDHVYQHEEDSSLVEHPELGMFSFVEKLTPELLMHAIVVGNAAAVKNFLDKCPSEVNMKFLGKSFLHLAISAGQVHIMKLLLQYTPNVDVEDDDGDTPLHMCAHHNDEQTAQILINAGADVNHKNVLGFTPLEVAATVGHCRVLRLLVKHPNIQLDSQDFEGNTALHRAVLKYQSKAVAILLDAGADPIIFNENYMTPILEAAKNGFFPAMELFMEKFACHVNLVKADDGHCALHVAAANNHCDILCHLAAMDSCDLDVKNVVGHTPLYVATVEGYGRIVERIVGYGASVSAATMEGNTPLHVVMRQKNMRPLSRCTPEMLKVHDHLTQFKRNGSAIPPYVVVASFLLREGADLNAKNINGLSPLHMCPPDIASLLKSYHQEKHGSSYRGSLPRFTPILQTSKPQLDTKSKQHGSPKLAEGSTCYKEQPTPLGGVVTPTLLQPTKPQKVDLPSKTITKDKGVESHPTENQQGRNHSTKTDDDKDMVKPKLCFLCEDVTADVRFEPCGHIIMCRKCAERVKKCPTCRASVQVKTAITSSQVK